MSDDSIQDDVNGLIERIKECGDLVIESIRLGRGARRRLSRIIAPDGYVTEYAGYPVEVHDTSTDTDAVAVICRRVP